MQQVNGSSGDDGSIRIASGAKILTAQQQQIIKSVGDYERIKISAFAGTGKTTTLISVAQAYPKMKFLYLAFNRAIADEAKRKFGDNVHVMTTHGLAYRFTKTDLDLKKVRPDYKPREIQDILGVSDWSVAGFIRDVFAEYCYSSHMELTTKIIDRLVEGEDALILSRADLTKRLQYFNSAFVLDKLKLLFDKFLNREIDITHNFYLKYFHLNFAKYKGSLRYSAIFLDESQDTNSVTMSIFESLPGKKVIIGDSHQSIYNFRKSIDAMKKFQADCELYLSISFRVPESVASKATSLLCSFKGEREVIEALKKEPDEIITTCHISRTNSRLVEIIAELEGARFKTVRDPEEIFKLPKSLYYFKMSVEMGGQRFRKEITVPWLNYFHSFREIKKYAEDVGDIETQSAIRIVEKFDSDIIYLEGIAKQNVHLKDADIFLTTAHTSKGLEWDRVIIEGDFSDIIEMISAEDFMTMDAFRAEVQAKNPPDDIRRIVEEINLFYVAITRAKKQLVIHSSNSEYLEQDDLFLNDALRTAKKKDDLKSHSFKSATSSEDLPPELPANSTKKPVKYW